MWELRNAHPHLHRFLPVGCMGRMHGPGGLRAGSLVEPGVRQLRHTDEELQQLLSVG